MIRLFINILAFVREWLFGQSDTVRKSKTGPVKAAPTSRYKQIAIIVMIFASLFANYKLGSLWFKNALELATLRSESKEIINLKERITAFEEMNNKLIKVIADELTCNGKNYELIQNAQELAAKNQALIPPKTKVTKETATTTTTTKSGTTTVKKEEKIIVTPHAPEVVIPGVAVDPGTGGGVTHPDWPTGYNPPQSQNP